MTLHVRLQPRAARNELAGLHGDALKVRVTAPPVDGLANKALCAYLADLLGVPAGRISIRSGHTGRDKLVRVEGKKGADVLALLRLTRE
ncbi:MAG: DUF167 domain-containing protein [Thermoanaerobacterales bacterium]|nr:DUF167 domain-containing protein [Thermoanaerobacterales bacterium]